MKTASLTKDLEFNDNKVSISVIMETETAKEIRILFKKGQEMKAHKAGFPITVAIHQGTIVFGVNNQELVLKEGDIIALEANVPHSLVAEQESIVRLTLSKFDSVSRVEKLAD